MKIIVADNYLDLSQKAAAKVIQVIGQKSTARLGLATGDTPIGMYQELCENHLKYGTSYQHVQTFNLDEYVGLQPSNKNSYHQYMNMHLFQHIDMLPENTHIPNGIADDLELECYRYESLIADEGGVDLQVLGIGHNGHIGFNEPGTPFHSSVHTITLSGHTREANSRFFRSLDEVPTHAITMGIATIMRAKEILLLISGREKRDAFIRLMDGSVEEQFPASILKKHPNVTVILNDIAYS